MLGLTNHHVEREYVMKAVAQTGSRQSATATTGTNWADGDGTFRCSSVIPPAVADHGKIVLGAGFRLPTNRQAASASSTPRIDGSEGA